MYKNTMYLLYQEIKVVDTNRLLKKLKNCT